MLHLWKPEFILFFFLNNDCNNICLLLANIIVRNPATRPSFCGGKPQSKSFKGCDLTVSCESLMMNPDVIHVHCYGTARTWTCTISFAFLSRCYNMIPFLEGERTVFLGLGLKQRKDTLRLRAKLWLQIASKWLKMCPEKTAK